MSTESQPPPRPADEARLLGQALRALRMRMDKTQQEAADAYGVTRGAWQNYENGRSIILRTDVQTRLAKALGSDREELLLQVAALTNPRDRRSVTGLSEPSARPYDLPADRQQAIFPLGEGEVVLTYPSELSEQGLEELTAYLATFLKARKPRES